jgi:hypothetical protein
MKTTNEKCRTYNLRFGASGAVARPKVCADLQVLRPSDRQWKPRLRQAAGSLAASSGDTANIQLKSNK